MLSNLPPGVTDSDIPGNRPDDIEWEAFHDWIDKSCVENNLNVSYAKYIWLHGLAIKANLDKFQIKTKMTFNEAQHDYRHWKEFYPEKEIGEKSFDDFLVLNSIELEG